MKLNCEFFYGYEADQFKFYRVPQILVTDKRFKNVSYGAKLLYGVLLDRMGLSILNKWYDDKNRAFIIYSINEVIESLSCSRGTAVKFMSELENIGLIERKKRGQGNPDYIYVKKFVDKDMEVDFKKSKICTSESSNNEFQDVQDLEPNNTDKNNTEKIYTDSIISYPQRSRKDYEDIIKENIEYDILKLDFKDDWLDNIIEIMLDVVCSDSETIRINKTNIPIEQVRERYLSINDMHIRYVDDAMRMCDSEVRNIRAFFITTLYNAPVTMDAFYDRWVKNDMKRGLI